MGSSLTCQLPRGKNQDRFVPSKGRTEGWVIPISPYKYHQLQEGCSPRPLPSLRVWRGSRDGGWPVGRGAGTSAVVSEPQGPVPSLCLFPETLDYSKPADGAAGE